MALLFETEWFFDRKFEMRSFLGVQRINQGMTRDDVWSLVVEHTDVENDLDLIGK